MLELKFAFSFSWKYQVLYRMSLYLNPSSKMIFRLIFNGEFMNYENACGGLMEDNASWYFQVNINECNFSPDRIQYISSMLESLVCSRCQAWNYQFLFILNKYLLLYTKLFYKINVLFDGLAAIVRSQNHDAPFLLELILEARHECVVSCSQNEILR